MTLLLLFVASALAGVGVTGSLGGAYDGTAWAPSLDWRGERLLVQLHLLDQLAPIAAGVPLVPNTGADVTLRVAHDEVLPGVDGVVMPGVGFRLTGSPLEWNASLEARIGVETRQRARVGLYVVPLVGVTTLLQGQPNLNYGGTVQASVWLAR